MAAEREPDLPVTPSNEGRSSNLENFGYCVAFNDLWPMGAALGVSSVMGFVFFVAGYRPAHWSVCLVVMLLPLGGAHWYLKKVVEGALPHAQEDMFAAWQCLWLDWSHPGWCPLWPAWKRSLALIAAPPWHGATLHPMLRLRKQFGQKER